MGPAFFVPTGGICLFKSGFFHYTEEGFAIVAGFCPSILDCGHCIQFGSRCSGYPWVVPKYFQTFKFCILFLFFIFLGKPTAARIFLVTAVGFCLSSFGWLVAAASLCLILFFLGRCNKIRTCCSPQPQPFPFSSNSLQRK